MVSGISAVNSGMPLTPVGVNTGTAVHTGPKHLGVDKNLTRPEIDTIVNDLNETVQLLNTSLSFSVDGDTGKTVIKVMNSTTHEVIRQIPAEEMLRVAARMRDLLGVLFDGSR